MQSASAAFTWLSSGLPVLGIGMMFCVLFAMQSPGRRNHGSCLLLATVGCCVLTPEPSHTSVPVQPLMGTETFVLLLRVQSSSSSSLRGEKVPYRKHSSNNKHSPTLSFFSLSVTLELFLLFDTEIRTVPRKVCGCTSILEIRVVKFFPLCPWELEQF